MQWLRIVFAATIFMLTFQGTVLAKKKEIRVQIKHNQKVVVDTIIYEDEEHAKATIESLVMRFSVEEPMISSENIFGLYVFNIDNENWKGEDTKNHSKKPVYNNSTAYKSQQPTSVYIDSLFDELGDELEEKWERVSIEMVIDSVEVAFDEIRQRFRESEIHSDPTVNQFKKDVRSIYDKIRSTKVIIVHEGDTLPGK